MPLEIWHSSWENWVGVPKLSCFGHKWTGFGSGHTGMEFCSSRTETAVCTVCWKGSGARLYNFLIAPIFFCTLSSRSCSAYTDSISLLPLHSWNLLGPWSFCIHGLLQNCSILWVDFVAAPRSVSIGYSFSVMVLLSPGESSPMLSVMITAFLTPRNRIQTRSAWYQKEPTTLYSLTTMVNGLSKITLRIQFRPSKYSPVSSLPILLTQVKLSFARVQFYAW